MASRGGGSRSPLPASVGRGSGAVVGRARGRGGVRGPQGSAVSQQTPRSPGTTGSNPPQVPGGTTENLREVPVKAHITSLKSSIDIEDVTEYFRNVCNVVGDGEIELSNAHLLGKGKADIVLKGLSESALQTLQSIKSHKIKSRAVKVEFKKIIDDDEDGPPPLEEDCDGEGEGEGERGGEGEEDEGSIAKLEVANVPSTVSPGALKTFFETARSGGVDGAVSDITNVKPGVFHVTFHDHKVAAQVMSEPRTFKKAVLQIQLVEDKDESDSEEPPNQIEVHNVPETVNEKLLKTYFEMAKSGSCTGAVADCKKIKHGVFIVAFHDPTVAAKVMSTTPQLFKKASLSLKYVQHVKQKEEFEMNQLVVNGLPDGIEKDVYELIIADILKMDEDEDFELVIDNKSTAIITFAKCYSAEELNGMMSAISNKQVEGNTVTVEMVKITKPSIHISNISTDCNKDSLEMYFGSNTLSGGGEIENVTICSSSEAIITFADPTVNLSVLERNHPILGTEAVLVECNGNNTSSEEVSPPIEPLEIPLDPLLVQSIKQSPSSLEQSIHASNVTYTTDEEKGLLILSPKGKPKPNWRQECQEKVPQYVAQTMTKERITVPKEVAARAKASVVELQKKNPSLTIYLNGDGTEITIAGETECVLQAKEAINSVCSEQITHTVSIPLAPEDYDFLEQVKHQEFHASVKCTFDSSSFSVILKGPLGIVTKLKDTMYEIVSHVDTPVLVDPLVTEYFASQISRGKLEKFLQERNCHVALHFNQFPLSMQFLHDDKETKTVKAVIGQLRQFVTGQAIPIPDSIRSFFSDMDEFIQLCQTCEQKHEVLIKQVGHEVSAAGFKADVTGSLAEIKDFLDKMASPLPPLEMKVGPLVARSLNRSPHGLQKCLQPLHVNLRYDTTGGILVFTPLHYLKPDWEQACKKSVSQYIQGNIVEQKVVVPKDAYQEAMSALYSAEHSDGTFAYHYPPNSISLSFVGEPETVKSTNEIIVSICANHSFVTEDVPLKPKLYEYITQLKLQDLTTKSGVEIEQMPDSRTLVLSGATRMIKAVKDNINTLTAQILTVQVNIEETVVQFLACEKGRDRLFSLLREKQSDKCAIFISESPMKLSLLCIQKHRAAAEKASKAIVEYTSMEVLKIPDMLHPFLSVIIDEAKRLEREISAIVWVKDSEIAVAGFKDGVSQATDALSHFVKDKEVHFQPISIPIDVMIADCIEDDKDGLQACVSGIHVTCTLKADKSKSKAAVCVSPTLATPADWKEKCNKSITSYIDKEFVKDQIEIPKEAASEVYPILMSTQTNHNLHFKMTDDGAYAIIAGKREVVETLHGKINHIFSHKQTYDKVKLSKRDYDFFTQVMQPTLPTGITIEGSPETYSITVSGSIHDVNTLVKSMTEMKFIKVPVMVDEVVVKLIQITGRQRLETSIQRAGAKAAIHVNATVHPPTLELLCHHKFSQKLEELAEKFPKQIETITLQLPKTLTKSSVSKEFDGHCKQVMKKCQVLIVSTTPDVLKICGFMDTTGEARTSIEMFIKKKCIVSQPFSIQSGMWRLLDTHMRHGWMNIETLCNSSDVKFTTPTDNDDKVIQIDFKGDKVEVQKVVQAMNQLVKTISVSVVPLKNPEIRRHFSEREDGGLKIPGIEKNAKVCIEVCTVGEDMDCGLEEDVASEVPKSKSTAHRVPKLLKECTAQVVDMKCIIIHVGDITEFRTDVIVNASNEDLKHVGGVADAILKKGGQEIQVASDSYIRSHGKLNTGDVWFSQIVGNLPCFAIVHAVGPRWHGNPSGRQQLRRVCIKSLSAAINYNSIALPAISSGVFGCPIDECADIMISAIIDFCNTQGSSTLDEINIVLYRQSDVSHFVQALHNYLPAQSIRRRPDSSMKSSSHLTSSTQMESSFSIQSPSPIYEEKPESTSSDDNDELQVLVTAASPSSLSRVLVQQGSILDVEAEIYVNSTNGNMDLSGGAVAQALAKAAGPSLQAECTKKAPIAAGEIAVTGPGNIRRCKCIIHINCPGYDKSGGQAEEMLRTIMNKCMRECDKRGASTIVFPAIGTGNLGFPVETAAHIMVDEVCNYLQKNKCKSLSMVYFIIFMGNMYRTFCDGLEQRKKVTGTVPQTPISSSKQKKSKKTKKKGKSQRGQRGRRLEEPPPDRSPQSRYRGQQGTANGDGSLDLGNRITVEILKGDITSEKTDVIVNTTNKEMSLRGGGVSVALAKKAGADLQRACDEIKPKKKQCLVQGKVLDTRSGNLECKSVFHIVFQKKHIVQIIGSCIERAVELKYSSIAFPGIGTGMEGCPADVAAKEMMKGLQQSNPHHDIHVRIVLFEDKVHRVFRAVVDDLQLTWYQRAGRAVKSLVTWNRENEEYEENEEPMDVDVHENEEDIELRIFGETEDKVQSAVTSINRLISKQFTTEECEHESIRLLHKNEEKALKLEARKLQLVFRIDRNLNSIELKGSKESISEMTSKIKDALYKAEKEDNRKAQAETVMKTVQWVRQDSSETHYDPVTNLEIEEAYGNIKPTYEFKNTDSGEHFTINFKQMAEIDHTMQDEKCKVRRVVEGAEGGGLPDDWDSMEEVPLRVVDVPPGSDGYQFALAQFHKTMTQGTNYSSILKIQRIQNPALYGQYAAKKTHLDAHNPKGVQNERWLFHGTKETSVAKINKTNFNRSFRGQNGTVFGQGTYFARDASYSNGYAPADAQGQKRMYLVRVLAGEYTRGTNAMIVAPAKDPNDENVLFDSVVDNTANPSIFVVFYDADAYPEYLITYK